VLRALDEEFVLTTPAESRGSVGSPCASRPDRFCLHVGGDEPRHDGADGSSAHRSSRPGIKGTGGSIPARVHRVLVRGGDPGLRPHRCGDGLEISAEHSCSACVKETWCVGSCWLLMIATMATVDRFALPLAGGIAVMVGVAAFIMWQKSPRASTQSIRMVGVAVVVATVVLYSTGLADGGAVHDMKTMSSPAYF